MGWIAKATENKGGLHRSLGVAEGKKIPASMMAAKSGDSPRVKKQKNLAKTLARLRKKK